MIRAMVERYTKCDALDMTWVRFRRTAEALSRLVKISTGKPLTAEEEFEMDRESRAT